MKTSIKYLAAVIVTVILSFSINSITYAQHRGGGGGGGSRGGGGGGFHGGGGGGFHSSGGGGFHGNAGGGYHSSGSIGRSSRGSYSGGQRPAARVQSQSRGSSHQQLNVTSRSYSSAPRGSVTQSYASRGGQRAYAGSVRSGINGRGVYMGGRYRGGYGYRGGYSRYYAPRIGFHINVLPYGYYPFYWGDDQFYYDNGLFYQQYDNSTDYQVVAPPMGAIMPNVPQDAKSITIDGQQYYELNGVYYQPVTTSDGTTGYKIVGKDGELNTDQNNGDYNNQDGNNNAPDDNNTSN